MERTTCFKKSSESKKEKKILNNKVMSNYNNLKGIYYFICIAHARYCKPNNYLSKSILPNMTTLKAKEGLNLI